MFHTCYQGISHNVCFQFFTLFFPFILLLRYLRKKTINIERMTIKTIVCSLSFVNYVRFLYLYHQHYFSNNFVVFCHKVNTGKHLILVARVLLPCLSSFHFYCSFYLHIYEGIQVIENRMFKNNILICYNIILHSTTTSLFILHLNSSDLLDFLGGGITIGSP